MAAPVVCSPCGEMADLNLNPLHSTPTLTSIPENLLLEIFRYLPTRDLCTIGRVCRAWRRVARDNSLWRHVNLQPYKLNLQRTWKVVRTHFSEVLLSLRMRGYMDPGGVSWNKNSLSDAMLRDLQERCPNMAIIDITCSNLTPVSLERFPEQLKEIHLTHSLIPNGWFKHMATAGVFPKLTHMDLTKSSKSTDSDIKDIVTGTKLRSLQLNGSYRITEKGFKAIADTQPELEVLEVSESQCTDLALQYIGKGLKQLTVLDVSQCQRVTDDGVGIISACLNKLELLNLSSCGGITKVCLGSLLNMKTLKRVNLTKTQLTESDITTLDDRCIFDQK